MSRNTKSTSFRDFSDWATPTVLIVAIVAAFVAIVFLAVEEEREWKEFAATHDCKIIAKTNSSTGYAMTSDGKMGTVLIPGTNTYRCNDGVDYTRSN